MALLNTCWETHPPAPERDGGAAALQQALDLLSSSRNGSTGRVGSYLLSVDAAAAGIPHPELISVPITPLSDIDVLAEMLTDSTRLQISAGHGPRKRRTRLFLRARQLLF